LLEQPPEHPTAAARARDEIRGDALVVFAVVELAQHVRALASRDVLLGRTLFGVWLDPWPDAPRADRAEDLWRVGDRLSTHGDRQRRGGRLAACGDSAVDEGAHCRRQYGVLDC